MCWALEAAKAFFSYSPLLKEKIGEERKPGNATEKNEQIIDFVA
jgi:hypothetical protein